MRGIVLKLDVVFVADLLSGSVRPAISFAGEGESAAGLQLFRVARLFSDGGADVISRLSCYSRLSKAVSSENISRRLSYLNLFYYRSE